MKTKIIFFGSDDFVIQVLKKLQENFDVVAVVTTSGSVVYQNISTTTTPVLTPVKLDEIFNSSLKTYQPDLFVVASYGKIIPKSSLDIPVYGALNIHPSLLPKYRGPSPVPTTILNGDKETGVTIIKMDEKMDHGPVVCTRLISLLGKEELQKLITKLFQLGSEALIEIIPQFIKGEINLITQDESQVSFCKMLKKEDGYFNIDNPPSSEILDRMIRAYNPWPGVWTKWNNKIVKFYPNNMIQMEGKRILSKIDFLNGYPNFPIKNF
jgi:methionyl-tRNA formyltransferase